MPNYLSPGVYVEEVPSAIKPIAGVSTSTAGFVGVVPGQIKIVEVNPDYDPSNPTIDTNDQQVNLRYRTWVFPVTKDNYDDGKKDFDTNKVEDASKKPIQGKGVPAAQQKVADKQKDVDTAEKALKDAGQDKTKSDAAKTQLETAKKASMDALNELKGKLKDFRDAQEALALTSSRYASSDLADPEVPVLCTTFADFTKHFGGFSTDPDQNKLAQGVYGFFNNGGTRCYVMRFASLSALQDPQSLTPFDAIDEISIVAAPGINDPVVQDNLLDHCENMSDRFAILDPRDIPEDGTVDLTETNIKAGSPQLALPPIRRSDYGALYFPRIKVFSFVAKLLGKDFDGAESDDGEVYVGPSGHMAGIYARTDHERGVHKAPANEVVRGALSMEFQISRPLQDGLNPGGVNCIRYINEDPTVWGARTIGGDLNADTKYINVRRTLLYLRKSIDHGTQWVVFEPNDRSLWQKIVRNVTDFLTRVWRDGALFGSTPQEAFWVKCDDETNPPEEREVGKVTTEIGVAIVRPAEFVIFRIQQVQPGQSQ
jgi:phage tail sheath protein FI